jgi:hypothetical protein
MFRLKSSFTGALCSSCILFITVWLGAPTAAQAQEVNAVCGAAVKDEVVKTLAQFASASDADQLKQQAILYDKFKFCATSDAPPATDPLFVTAQHCGAKVHYAGSIFYEEMPCCGYDPQRRTFACPVKIKQNFGFGPAPLPGSREFVLHCVANAAGVLQPVGADSVHLANSTLLPSWQFAVVANANNGLGLVQPMSGAQRIARSILSWNFKPTSCAYLPIWGNVIDYKVRLDQ